ncbi:MAG: 4-hydroxy-tetrahydrodipicolinate synthase [Bacteroidales bacterium]|nr:4-hydroxy-tetrahydrodipicolinate synthase [Bacteroidales bacterium]MEE3412814.1 4-hydroxy-tetrahydrodipicolinate synthase [Bacteroidales bacterium]
MNFNTKGTGVALVTPFDKRGNVDFSALGRLIDHCINGGIDYLVCLGTTSEYPTLTEKETFAVRDYIVEYVDKRVPIVLGVGGNNTKELVTRINHTDLSGFAAILSVSPYYNKPSQKGLYTHYNYIAAASPLPVIIYNVPGRTGVNISAETTLKLAEDFKNIIGIKEASGNMLQCMEILRCKPDRFSLISGEDALTYPLITCGANGVISVTANAYPNMVSTMVNQALKGSNKKALALHNTLLPFTNAIFEEGNPSGVKAALESMGICDNIVRLPLSNVSRALYNRLQSYVKEHK